MKRSISRVGANPRRPVPPSIPMIQEKNEAMGIAPCSQAQTGSASGCEAHLITTDSQLEELQTEWGALFDVAPTASPPLRWEWVREWWRIYGPIYGDRGRGLRIIIVRRGPQLIGVLPLYQMSASGPWGARQLRFISTGAAEFEETCAEYHDLLHVPGAAGECVAAVGRALTDGRVLPWDQLDLSEMSVRSPLLGLREPLGARGIWTKLSEPGVCYISDLSGGFEAYLRRLSQGARGEARKLLREVERAGMVFELAASVEEADRYFDQMVELHRHRWTAVGKSGSFSPLHAEFHRSVARALVPAGKAVLARLSLEGRTYTVAYGHLTGETYHCYQRGVCMETRPVRSPGTATILLLMAELAGHGIVRYDHLAGINSFKERFATAEHPLAELRIVKPTFRYLSTAIGDLARRATTKAARLIKRSLPGGKPLLKTDPASLPRVPGSTI